MAFTYRLSAAGRGGTGPSDGAPGGRRRRGRDDRHARSYSGWLGLERRGALAMDALVAGVVLVLLYLVVSVGHDATLSFSPTKVTSIDTSPARLPYDAVRSLVRMFLALFASYAFTFVYATIAARARRAGALMLPLLDMLQSVPVLGFLSITVSGFIALFPGSYVGLELASVFAIFTSQAWNLAFAFHQSLTTQPRELDEAARLMGLSRWRRFWKLDVPSGATSLVWNGMMSMGGGWFFLVASEAISVTNRTYALPGIGSYAGAAIDQGSLGKVGLAAATMAIVVLGVNFAFWRPLLVWCERYKYEQSASTDVPRSAMLGLLRRSRWPRRLGALRRRGAEPLNRLGDRVLGTAVHDARPGTRVAARDITFWALIGGATAWALWRFMSFVTAVDGWAVLAPPLGQGVVTMVRVVVVLVLSSIVWVPVGIAIGLRPRAARLAQPVVQLLASFPANFAFPFAVALFVRTGLGLDVGGVLLMALGAQWYVLFNVIAGAQSIPRELIEAMDDLGVTGVLRWRRLLLPAVFPAYVTGGITAAGGAWNASIVAEIVTYGGHTLTATGLGAYVALATSSGDTRHVLAGVAVMALYVVGLNRLLWRRLHDLAHRRFRLL